MFKADVTRWANPGLKVLMEQVTHLDASHGKTGLTQVVYGVSKELNELLLQHGTQTEIHDGLLSMTGHAVDTYAEELPHHRGAVEDMMITVGLDITFNKHDITIIAMVNSHERKGKDKGITTFVGFITQSEEAYYIRERAPHGTLQ